MRTIPLNGKKAAGRVALIDDADYELVSRHQWHVVEFLRGQRGKHGPYAEAWIRRDGKQVRVLMHRLLVDYREVDHADGDGLNNQRSNLRPITVHGQNQANSKPRRGYTSQFKGVSWAAQGYWRADIMVKRHRANLGYFKNEEDAARAYDAAALAAWGEFARLNFPEGEPCPTARSC